MTDSDRENVTQALLAREEEAWRALAAGTGADFYRRNLTDDALMVFPFGVLDRAATIAAIEAAPPWAWFRIDEPKVVRLAADAALLTYRATAQRTGQAPYTAWMTTVFVQRDGTWKTAFHQQTPTDN
jgi:hypothetical protein